MKFIKAILFLIKCFWHWSLFVGALAFFIFWLIRGDIDLYVWVYGAFFGIGTFLLLSVLFGNYKREKLKQKYRDRRNN